MGRVVHHIFLLIRFKKYFSRIQLFDKEFIIIIYHIQNGWNYNSHC